MEGINTYSESMPDHLTIHEFVADITFYLTPRGNKLHL